MDLIKSGEQVPDTRTLWRLRDAYRVLYESDAEFLNAMKDFDPNFQVIPNVSNPESRRGLVERLLSGNKRRGDPYRTGHDFHFEDVKYFLGEKPIDLIFFETHTDPILRPLMQSFYGLPKTPKLVKTALNNVGVKFRHAIVAGWDSDRPPSGRSVFYCTHMTNPEFKRKAIPDTSSKQQSLTPMLEFNYKEGEYKNPLLVIENQIYYGRKHQEIEFFLHSHGLGIDYRTLVFNFIGYIAFDPWDVPCRYMKNVLKLI